MSLAAVVVDVDGTLAETERDGHRVAYNQAFAELGIRVHWSVEEYGRWLSVAGGKERLVAYFEAHPDLAPAHVDFDAIHRAKSAAYTALVRDGRIPLRPGVRRLLDELAEAKVPVAVASTTSYDAFAALAEVHFGSQWRERFAALAFGDVVVRKKPDPGIYHWALGALGASYDTVVAIEDNRNGLLAAKGAGLAVVVVRSLYAEGEDLTEADAVADGFGEQSAPARIVVGGHERKGVVDLALMRSLLDPA